MDKTHLYVLWTDDNPITAEKMVFMYTINSLIHGWWEKVTLIIWGAPAKLVSEDATIQKKIKEALDAGVHVTACKACGINWASRRPWRNWESRSNTGGSP